MTDSDQLPSPEDGLKDLEENPEKTQAVLDLEDSGEVLNRHEGSVTTTAGESSEHLSESEVEELTAIL